MLDKIWKLQGVLDRDRSPYFVPNMQPGHFDQCPDTPWHAAQYSRGDAFKRTSSSFLNQSGTEEFLPIFNFVSPLKDVFILKRTEMKWVDFYFYS